MIDPQEPAKMHNGIANGGRGFSLIGAPKYLIFVARSFKFFEIGGQD